MRKIFMVVSAFMFFSFVTADTPITDKERKSALDLLTSTQSTLEKSIEGLSDAQLNFKANDSSWSVDGCVKHIAVSEKMLWGAVEQALKQPANPEKRADIKVTDEQLVGFMESRATKVKTMDAMKPENTSFKSTAEALASIKESRKRIIDFVGSTQDDLRNYVIQLPFGSFDAYQMVLLIGAHSNRHTQQLEEVKTAAGFPAN
ncbi:MAG: DinB family protein [Chitinophagaceae bacterium]|nr:DinB family protein [Chitinophagaceae bacterium]